MSIGFSYSPKFTVVVPSLNQAAFIRICLNSIVRQDYPRDKVELIVMDGGSSDGSVEIIREFEERIYYWRSQPDGGQSSAVNDGIRRGTGDLVAWLNSDDFYLPGTLTAIAEGFRQRPWADCVHGAGFKWHTQHQRLAYLPAGKARQGLLRHFGNHIIQPSCFWTRSWWENRGGLNPDLELVLDFDFHLGSLAAGGRYAFLNQALTIVILHGLNKSLTLTRPGERVYLQQTYALSPRVIRTTWGRLFYGLSLMMGGDSRYVASAIWRRLSRRPFSGIPLSQAEATEVLGAELFQDLRSIGRRTVP